MGKEITIYCDGGSRGNPGPGASGFVIFDEAGGKIASVGRFLGHTTNNQAEYQAVLFALRHVLDNNIAPEKINFRLDSELIVKQMNGEYRIKDLGLQKHAIEIRNLERNLGVPISFVHVPRNQNKLADAMVNKALDREANVED